MTAIQMLTNIRNEELEVSLSYRDYDLIDTLDGAIEILSGEKPEGNTSEMAKRLIDFRDAYQYPEEWETRCFNEAIIALVAA